MTFGERCKKCKHSTHLHHFADGSTKLWVCEGEASPCLCVTLYDNPYKP